MRWEIGYNCVEFLGAKTRERQRAGLASLKFSILQCRPRSELPRNDFASQAGVQVTGVESTRGRQTQLQLVVVERMLEILPCCCLLLKPRCSLTSCAERDGYQTGIPDSAVRRAGRQWDSRLDRGAAGFHPAARVRDSAEVHSDPWVM